MLLNEHTALVTSQILLCPYSEHHVPTYHEWMKDEELQALTASEPLSLPEEYDMQRSWRQDSDKLTFIACLPPSTPVDASTKIIPKQDDAPSRMIGDINLFLFDDDDDDEGEPSTSTFTSTSNTNDPKPIIGEIELMIALSSHHRKGHGRASLLTFLAYILKNTTPILSEYTKGASSSSSSSSSSSARLNFLRVKINKDNVKSIALFQSVGFVRTSAEANYFGEVELRLWVKGKQDDVLVELEKVKGWNGSPLVVDYREE